MGVVKSYSELTSRSQSDTVWCVVQFLKLHDKSLSWLKLNVWAEIKFVHGGACGSLEKH